MTPEADQFLGKAKRVLIDAGRMLSSGMNDAAGRAAYIAAFHAAQALIWEREGRVVKTPDGVHSAFHRLINNDADFDPTLGQFLSQSYDLKAIADYETAPERQIAPERAASAVEGAHWFVAQINLLLQPA